MALSIQEGLNGLKEKSRAPKSIPHKIPQGEEDSSFEEKAFILGSRQVEGGVQSPLLNEDDKQGREAERTYQEEKEGDEAILKDPDRRS